MSSCSCSHRPASSFPRPASSCHHPVTILLSQHVLSSSIGPYHPPSARIILPSSLHHPARPVLPVIIHRHASSCRHPVSFCRHPIIILPSCHRPASSCQPVSARILLPPSFGFASARILLPPSHHHPAIGPHHPASIPSWSPCGQAVDVIFLVLHPLLLFFGPLWAHFFCPITQGVIGQKKWFPLGSILEHSGSRVPGFGAHPKATARSNAPFSALFGSSFSEICNPRTRRSTRLRSFTITHMRLRTFGTHNALPLGPP